MNNNLPPIIGCKNDLALLYLEWFACGYLGWIWFFLFKCLLILWLVSFATHPLTGFWIFKLIPWKKCCLNQSSFVKFLLIFIWIWNPFQIVCLCNIPIKARNCVILILVFLGSCLGDSYSLYHYLGFRSQFQVAKASGV